MNFWPVHDNGADMSLDEMNSDERRNAICSALEETEIPDCAQMFAYALSLINSD